MATLDGAARQETVAALTATLAHALSLSPTVAAGLTEASGLFGQLPELDSMAVATVLTAIEDRFGILIDDADVSAEMFETVGALARYVEQRLAAR